MPPPTTPTTFSVCREGQLLGPSQSRMIGSDPFAVLSDGRDRLAVALLGHRRMLRLERRLLLAFPHASDPSFTHLRTDDLSFLFAAYDARFFERLCGKPLWPVGLSFRLSGRMTRAEGKTHAPSLP